MLGLESLGMVEITSLPAFLSSVAPGDAEEYAWAPSSHLPSPAELVCWWCLPQEAPPSASWVDGGVGGTPSGGSGTLLCQEHFPLKMCTQGDWAKMAGACDSQPAQL